MWEEIRDHSAEPSAQEREWMAARPLVAMRRVGVQALLALVVAMAASHALQTAPEANVTVAAAPAR